MKDTLLFILQHIVEHPGDASVEEQENQNGKILVIHVHPDDMGKVIGKSGRIIRALRDIIKVIATKQNTYVDITLHEEPLKESLATTDA